MGQPREEMRMRPIASGVPLRKREEGELAVRDSPVMLGFVESLQQRILSKCKRCFCPASRCVK